MKTAAPLVLLLLALIVLDASAQSIASVSGGSIGRVQLEQRIAVEEAYGGRMTPEAALVTLVNDLVEREVASPLGLLPDSSELLRFGRFVDSASKAPQILAKVKKVFGADSSTYRSAYLLPRLVNMKLHRFFLGDSALHAAARTAIEKAHSFAAKGIALPEAARRSGLRYGIDSVRGPQRPPGASVARFSGVTSTTLDPYRLLLAGMNPGEIHGNIVETDRDYRVLRMSSRSDSVEVVEVIAAPKGEYGEWFRSLATKIEVAIDDRQLRESVIRAYPQLWWVGDGGR